MIVLYFILGFVLIILIIAYIILYNELVRLKNNISKAWANIDVLLKQRFDELSKLIDTVKGYMKYEKNLFVDVTKARNIYNHACNVKEVSESSKLTKKSIGNIFAVAENYPDLKANRNFLKLQARITEIENMIADRREFFNDSVTVYNTRIKQIPYNVITSILNYKQKDLFEATDSEKKKINFDRK